MSAFLYTGYWKNETVAIEIYICSFLAISARKTGAYS